MNHKNSQQNISDYSYPIFFNILNLTAIELTLGEMENSLKYFPEEYSQSQLKNFQNDLKITLYPAMEKLIQYLKETKPENEELPMIHLNTFQIFSTPKEALKYQKQHPVKTRIINKMETIVE